LATDIVDRNAKFSDDVWHKGFSIPFAKNGEIPNEKRSPIIEIDPPPPAAVLQATQENRQSAQPRLPVPQFGSSSNPAPVFPFGAATAASAHSFPTGTIGIHSSQNSSGPQQGEKRKATESLENIRSKALGVRYNQGHEELEGILYDSPATPIPPPDTNIMEWIKREYTRSRGFELGSYDSSIVGILWKKQSENWAGFALGYISDIISLVHDFLLELLSEVCNDNRVRDGIVATLMDPITERYRQAVKHVQFIVQVERSGTMLTTNHYFNDSVQKW
jgi:hypothetical protein